MTSPHLTHLRVDVSPHVLTGPDPSTRMGGLPCATGDPERWFAEQPEVLEHAKSLCRTCPLRAACLAGALERREPWGVWGGELFDRGRVIPRKRGVGRPRKDRAA